MLNRLPTGAIDYDADDNGLIEIFNLDQLDAIRYDLDGNGEADDPSDADVYAEAFPDAVSGVVCPNRGCSGYELTRNLDFNDPDSYSSGSIDKGWSRGESGEGWHPIGSHFVRFNSTFDGDGHTIVNLFIDGDGADYVALFGGVSTAGAIRRVGLVEVEVSGRSRVGALAGGNGGTISDSYATGSVSGSERIGGLTGQNDREGKIRASYAACRASAEVANVGGLAGGNWGTVIGSHATGNVSGTNNVGGLAGWNAGPISTSYATGNVSGHQTVGGLVGDNNLRGEIIASYATGNVSGGIRIGGLVGESYDTIAASYATGRVSGSGRVGGLIGANFGGTIISSYATGAVSGSSSIGGLAGYNAHGSTIIGSYAIGGVSGSSNMGGLVGWNDDPDGITASYWDIETSIQSYGVGGGFNSGAKGKTTVELQASTSYTGIYGGWNIDIDNADGDDNNTTGADDPWDLGSSHRYPALKADFDGDGTATWQEFGDQLRQSLLPRTGGPSAPSGLLLALGLAGGLLILAGSIALRVRIPTAVS